jgi:dolichol-phosphate mannosyltransferase
VKLSVVIPAHDEEGCIEGTLRALASKLAGEGIEHELVVVNDNSRDRTRAILGALARELPVLRIVDNSPPHGFGFAVRAGLEAFTGDAVAVYMADASDRPEDLVRFFNALQSRGVDCVFGTRFARESRVIDYPWPKMALNRMANFFIRTLFGLRYNDITNAFKLYHRKVIAGVQPLLSHHFNLTVELPLKAIVRGYSYAVLPNDWINRKTGESKLKIKEMGSRYLFIVLYCFLEKWLSRGDYHRRKGVPA